jgi:nicotinamide riboside kinase
MDGDFDDLSDFASNCRVDLYLLTGDEIPFVQDGLRDGEQIRHEMHEWFIDALNKQDVPYLLVSGDKKERIEQAIKGCENLLNTPASILSIS